MKGIIFGFVALVVFIAVFNTTTTMNAAPAPTARPEPAGPQVMLRSQFLERCMVGALAVECQAALGSPDRTQAGTTGREYWHFAGRTRDETTGKIDHDAQIVIENNRVEQVNFY